MSQGAQEKEIQDVITCVCRYAENMLRSDVERIFA